MLFGLWRILPDDSRAQGVPAVMNENIEPLPFYRANRSLTLSQELIPAWGIRLSFTTISFKESDIWERFAPRTRPFLSFNFGKFADNYFITFWSQFKADSWIHCKAPPSPILSLSNFFFISLKRSGLIESRHPSEASQSSSSPSSPRCGSPERKAKKVGLEITEQLLKSPHLKHQWHRLTKIVFFNL